MPFKILCSCGVNLLATDDLASFKVVCPECGVAVNLPKVPDPYNLPTNAEMITIDSAEVGAGSGHTKSAATARRRAPARGGNTSRGRADEDDGSVNTTLIIVLVIVGLIILALSVNLIFGKG